MMMPKPPSRAALRAFWTVLSLTLALALGTLLGLSGLLSLSASVSASTALFLALAVAGVTYPYAVALPYRAWNWLAVQVAGALRTYVTAVCFVTVMLPASRGGPPFHFLPYPSSDSMWFPRESQPLLAYESEYHDSRVVPAGTGHSSGVRSWAWRSANYWALALVPFLLLLRLLSTAQQESSGPTSDIYTLY